MLILAKTRLQILFYIYIRECREVVESGVELEELREHVQPLVRRGRRDGRRHPEQQVDDGQAATEATGAGTQQGREPVVARRRRRRAACAMHVHHDRGGRAGVHECFN
jgi:hypothetical protein